MKKITRDIHAENIAAARAASARLDNERRQILERQRKREQGTTLGQMFPELAKLARHCH